MALSPGVKIYRLMDAVPTGEALRAARVKLDLTAKAAALSVGLTQAQLSRVENGQEYFTESVRARLQKWANTAGVRLTFIEGDWHGRNTATQSGNKQDFFGVLVWAHERGWLTRDQVVQMLVMAAP